MNRRQINCLWGFLTLALPSGYLVIEYLAQAEARLEEMDQIIWEQVETKGRERTLRFEDTKTGATYLLRTDKIRLSESYLDEQTRLLIPLSPQQIAAFDEAQVVKRKRALVAKWGVIGLFLLSSVVALALYNLRFPVT